jgi:hypothetical protein
VRLRVAVLAGLAVLLVLLVLPHLFRLYVEVDPVARMAMEC